jgi:AcrR family transcriptional regulator
MHHVGESVKRRYHAPRRADQARATRGRIVRAARDLFLEQGYPATTIAQVAATASVSPDTVYHVFGSKGQLLARVLDETIGGDDEDVQVLDREQPQLMRVEGDQRRQVAMFAQGMAAQLERVRPMDDILRSAAAVDNDARALREDLQLRQRREGMTTIAGWIAANGPLRDNQSPDRAAVVLWTLTSPEVHQLLCDQAGWSRQEYQDWLRDTLTDSLLGRPNEEGG